MLEVLDTAGQEEYTILRDQWIRDGEAFMLVYSISSRSSFARIRQFHAQVMRVKESRMGSGPFVYLVGNKCDRVDEREVSTQDGFVLARELECEFFEASSKRCINIEESFYGLVRAIRKQRTAVPRKPELPIILIDAAALSQDRPQPQKPSKFSSLTGLFRSPKSPNNSPRFLDLTQQMSLNRLLVQTARRDKIKPTKRLLDIGASPNGYSGADGRPLYAAAALGHSKMVTLLLDSGAAVNARSITGSTPLIIAAAEGHVEVVYILLARGASTNLHNDTHGTPLIATTFRCHSKVLKALLLHGAKVNKKGGQYDTALHTIATVGNADIAKILLEAGADVGLRDRHNCTALQVAAAAGHAEIVRLLLLRGAHSLIDDTQGKYGSALKAANDRSRFDVMKVLLEAGANEETLSIPPPPASTPSDVGMSTTPSFICINGDSDNPAAAKSNEGILIGGVESVSSGPTNGSQGPAEDDLLHEVANIQLLDSISADQNPNAGHQPSSPGIPALIHSAPSTDLDLDHASQHQVSSPHTSGTSNSQNAKMPELQDLSTSLGRDKASSIIAHYDYSGNQTIPWKFISRLGQGGCSTIEEIEATSISEPKTRYARKSFLVPPHSRRRLLSVIHNEVDILKALHHHHVARIHSTYCTEREFAIIMRPVAEMNLGEYLAYNSRPTGDSPIYSWFGCLTTAFDYLHERKIKHQDVKPANILIRDGQIVVADFGISKDVFSEATTGSVGPCARTLMYCAPEVATVEGDSRRGRGADIFSLGCVFLEMITTLLWVHGCSVQKLHDLIEVDERRVYSASLTKVLQWILMLYAFSRAGNETCSDATSVRSAKASCTQALQWCLAMLLADSDNRITADELRVAISRYQTWRSQNPTPQNLTATPSWVGPCCALAQEDSEFLAEPRVMHSWPGMALDAVTLGYAPWSWDDVKSRMTFRADSDWSK